MHDPSSPARVPLLHVGYHKAASTWLQTALFGDARAPFEAIPRPEVLERFVLVDPFAFDARAVRASLAGSLDAIRSRSRIPVLSHERLSGNPHSGGYDAAAIADRLAAALPEARVLIVIREQRSMIASVYKQYVVEGGAAPLRAYLHPPRAGEARIPLFRFGFFEYDAAIARYRELFGPERVLVLPFEALRREPPAFVERIAGFAGVAPPQELSWREANVGLSALAAALKRPANRLLIRDRLNPLGWSERAGAQVALRRAVELADRLSPEALRDRLERRLRGRVAREVGDRYRDSNRRTAALSGLDLASLGYDL